MSFFKAYDMRGRFGTDFDLDTVFKVGMALPDVVGGRNWLVGRDGRASSPAVRDALVAGLSAAGAKVHDIGLSSTPMVYFFTATDGYDGSVMVTASHNPPSDNGLKVSRKGALPVGYADGLDRVERIVAAGSASGCAAHSAAPAAESSGTGADASALARYIAWQKSATPDPAGLSYAVDCSNGMASLFVHELFPGAIVLNESIDGAFPGHSPNPLKAEAREQIAALVREKGLDCGVVFDGDADRCMFVDGEGRFVQPDYLIPVVARATAKNRGGKVVHDVRTSWGATDALRADGFEPVMVPVGHAFAKPAMRRTGAVCGGELAGHYYFGEFFGCDSGALAARRILSEIAAAKSRGATFAEMMAPISGKYSNSGELNFRVDDKDAAIARILEASAKFGAEKARSEIDGVRAEFGPGWISVRKSNTEPYLRLIAECDSPGRLAEWVELLSDAAGGRPE